MSSPEHSEPPSRPHLLSWLAAILGLVFMVYPMSVGPAIWAGHRGWVPMPTLHTIYRPLESLANHLKNPKLDATIRWYTQLWK